MKSVETCGTNTSRSISSFVLHPTMAAIIDPPDVPETCAHRARKAPNGSRGDSRLKKWLFCRAVARGGRLSLSLSLSLRGHAQLERERERESSERALRVRGGLEFGALDEARGDAEATRDVNAVVEARLDQALEVSRVEHGRGAAPRETERRRPHRAPHLVEELHLLLRRHALSRRHLLAKDGSRFIRTYLWKATPGAKETMRSPSCTSSRYSSISRFVAVGDDGGYQHDYDRKSRKATRSLQEIFWEKVCENGTENARISQESAKSLFSLSLSLSLSLED